MVRFQQAGDGDSSRRSIDPNHPNRRHPQQHPQMPQQMPHRGPSPFNNPNYNRGHGMNLAPPLEAPGYFASAQGHSMAPMPPVMMRNTSGMGMGMNPAVFGFNQFQPTMPPPLQGLSQQQPPPRLSPQNSIVRGLGPQALLTPPVQQPQPPALFDFEPTPIGPGGIRVNNNNNESSIQRSSETRQTIDKNNFAPPTDNARTSPEVPLQSGYSSDSAIFNLSPTPLPPSPKHGTHESDSNATATEPTTAKEPKKEESDIPKKPMASKNIARLYQKKESKTPHRKRTNAPGKRGRKSAGGETKPVRRRSKTRDRESNDDVEDATAEAGGAGVRGSKSRPRGRPRGRPGRARNKHYSDDDEKKSDCEQQQQQQQQEEDYEEEDRYPYPRDHIEFVSIETRPRRRRAIPQIEFVLKSDPEPDRITNPLLAYVPANFRKTQNDLNKQLVREMNRNASRTSTTSTSNNSSDHNKYRNQTESEDSDHERRNLGYRSVKVTGTIPVEEFLNSASLVYHRPDTYPISFLARLLGFDINVPDEEDFPSFPTPLPDPKSLPLRKDTIFLTIPPEGNRLAFRGSNQLLGATKFGDLDDRRILDHIDPVYRAFLEHGWDTKRSFPAKRNDSLKFIAKQNQQDAVRAKVIEMARELLGLSSDWTFRDWGSFQSKAQQEESEKQKQQQQKNDVGVSSETTSAEEEATTTSANTAKSPNESSNPTSPSSRSRINYHKYHGPLWTIDGKETFRYLPKHIFGILASFQGEPVAILKYQFYWYKLPNAEKESELVVLIHGIAYRATEVVEEKPTDGETQVIQRKDASAPAAETRIPNITSATATTEVPETAEKSQDIEQKLEAKKMDVVAAEDAREVANKEKEGSKPKLVENSVPVKTVESSTSSEKDVHKENVNKKKIVPFVSTAEKPTDAVKVVMLALALEHTRACGVFYGVWETPESLIGLNEKCFRMVKMQRNDIDEASQQLTTSNSIEHANDEQNNKNEKEESSQIGDSKCSSLQPMICDLKKCSSRLAILRLKEQKEGIFDSAAGIEEEPNSALAPTPERLLVEMPTFDKAHSFYGHNPNAFSRYSKRGLDQEVASLKIFSGATEAAREVFLQIRAKIGTDVEEKVEISKFDSQTGSYIKIPPLLESCDKESMDETKENENKPSEDEMADVIESAASEGKDSNDSKTEEQIRWRVMRCFPVEKTNTSKEDAVQKIEPENEVLSALKKKQDELIALEKGLEPQVRGILAEAIDERIQYELPETKLKKKDQEKIMMEFEEYLTKRKELEQVRQERREEDMDAVCSICNDGEVTPDNQILFCEACNVAVHQKCYGIERIPEGDYYCIACRYYKRDEMMQSMPETSMLAARESLPPLNIHCELCTVKRGAFTRVNAPASDGNEDSAKWVHMTCAKWNGLDFVSKGDASLVEDVAVFKQHYRRNNISCSICKGMWGSYSLCRHPGCDNYCHITCAIESGICQVVHGEDVEGNRTDNAWTMLCPNHSKIPKQPENVKRVQELIKSAGDFPEEPMPPPLLRDLGPYNKLTGDQRKVALSDRKYEDAYMENILRTKLAGVRCEICDVIEDIHGRNLSRCEDCGSVICHSCELFSNNPGQSRFKCHGCLYQELENKNLEKPKPQCSMCNQEGGLLLKASSKPMLRLHHWKKNPALFEKSLFMKAKWAHMLCAFWLPKVSICHDTQKVDLSHVIASDGYAFIQNSNRCGICGKRNGYKTKCSAGRCHAHGIKNKPYHFHATCARQIGFEVAHRDEDDFVVHCYAHGSNENNLRARLEDLIETEKKRAGKDFSRANNPMKFSDGSKLLHGAITVMRILGWAWRWAEWWVQFGSTWEPLLEPGQVESQMTAEELRIVESSKETRMEDARKCRLAAFGAALRNRNYDTEEGFNTKALERALRAVLNTRSLVGPLEEHEIEFFVDILARAYRSKSKLLGFGEDRIPVDENFCVHFEDKSSKFKLGDRPVPGNTALKSDQVFEDPVSEPDDYLKYDKNENGEDIDTSFFTEIDYKYKGSSRDDFSFEDSEEEADKPQVGGGITLPAFIETHLLDKGSSYLLSTRRGRLPKIMKLSIHVKINGRSLLDTDPTDDFNDGAENVWSPKKQKESRGKDIKSGQQYKLAETMMKFDQKGFGPLLGNKVEFLLYVGIKSVDEFMKTTTKEITQQYTDWRKLKDLPPLKDSQSAGNTLNKWKSDVRKYYSQFIGNVEDESEGMVLDSDEGKKGEYSKSDDLAIAQTAPLASSKKIETTISAKRSRRDSSSSDRVEDTRPSRKARRESGSQISNFESEGDAATVEASQHAKEALETRHSPRKTMDYRKGMYEEVDDQIETDSEPEIFDSEKSTAGRRGKSETPAEHSTVLDEDDFDETESEEERKPVEPIQKKRKRGRPPSFIKTLTKEGIDFLKLVGIKSDREFLSTNTCDLAMMYAEYRKETGQSVLKSTGNASKISSWKRIVRDAAVKAGYPELADVGFRQTKRGKEIDEKQEATEDENDECEVCGKPGDLLICDGCEKSYHIQCVNLEEVPDGDWFCPSCKDKCAVCREGGILIVCDGCENSYHAECAGLGEIPEGDWFCPKCDK